MIDFKPIELSDREWMERYLKSRKFECMEYSFTFSYIWQDEYDYFAAELFDFLVIYSDSPGYQTYTFSGDGDIKRLIPALLADAEERGNYFRIFSATAEQKALIEEAFPGRFDFTADRNNADYIYEAEKLRTLSGKKLQSKRNHISHFLSDYPEYSLEEISEENIPECIEMNRIWYEAGSHAENATAQGEELALARMFRDFSALKMKGMLVRVDGKVVAFTVGDELNPDIFMTHFEKALVEYRGIYPFINREFARTAAAGYEFINRQEDIGEEGLRKSKLSYYPARLGEKLTVTVK